MADKNRTSHRAYRRKRAALKSLGLPCWLCGKPIAYAASKDDPLSFSADHVDPVARGGHNLGELRAAHLGCNRKRSDRAASDSGILRTSREW